MSHSLTIVRCSAALAITLSTGFVVAQPEPGGVPSEVVPAEEAPAEGVVPLQETPATQPAPVPPVSALPPAPAPAGFGEASPAIDPGPAPDEGPREMPFNVFANYDLVWHTDPGFHLFSNNDIAPRPGISVSYDLLQLAPALVLAPEVGYAVEHEDTGVILAPIEQADLSAHHLNVAARLRYQLYGWLEPQGKLAAGLTFSEIALSYDGRTVEQADKSPFVALGIGFLLRTPDRFTTSGNYASLSGGVGVEGGYLLSSALDVSVGSDADDGRIRTERASLGAVSRSGPYLRVAAFVRF